MLFDWDCSTGTRRQKCALHCIVSWIGRGDHARRDAAAAWKYQACETERVGWRERRTPVSAPDRSARTGRGHRRTTHRNSCQKGYEGKRHTGTVSKCFVSYTVSPGPVGCPAELRGYELPATAGLVWYGKSWDSCPRTIPVGVVVVVGVPLSKKE